MARADTTRFLLRLACFLPLAAALMAVDWASTQPPVRRMFTARLDAAAAALIDGKTISARVYTLFLKPIWLEHVRVRPDVLVLGSSRAVQIPEPWFRPRSLLNAAMLGADFEDSVAMLEECLETGKAPRLVLLELAPSLTHHGKVRETPALAGYLHHALYRYGVYPPIFFSGPLTLDTVRWDPRLVWRDDLWRDTSQWIPETCRLRPDGSADWFDPYSRRSPEEAERVAIASMGHLDPGVEQWRTTSQPGWFDRRILNAMAGDLHVRGIQLVVLLVPVHPAVYDHYVAQGGYNDSWIRQDMGARGVKVIGAYSPRAAHVSRNDFFDDVHVYADALHRILREGGIVP